MSEPIQLVRKELKDGWRDTQSANPSLLMQKGFIEIEHPAANKNTDKETKKFKHLEKMAGLPAPKVYQRAFKRWFNLTSDSDDFCQLVMKLENRLLIGLSGSGALETGCALSHGYGMPYIPGSSVKGVVRAWAESHYGKQADGNARFQADIDELLGREDNEEQGNLAGLVTFHDAWWVPDPSNKEHKPFVLDVVTTHHQDYYNGGQAEPSDKDSPIPNHLLAVQGSFLFVIEGAPEHVELCQKMLAQALQDNGIGAKTAAGYGYMAEHLELLDFLIEESLPQVPDKIRIQREEVKQRKAEVIQQQQEAEQQRQERKKRELQEQAERAENAKTAAEVIAELNTDYKAKSGDENYRQKIEERINYAIQHWSMEDRLALAACLKDLGYIPTNKKNKNRESRKVCLQRLRGGEL